MINLPYKGPYVNTLLPGRHLDHDQIRSPIDHHIQPVNQYPGPELNDLWIMADGTIRLRR